MKPRTFDRAKAEAVRHVFERGFPDACTLALIVQVPRLEVVNSVERVVAEARASKRLVVALAPERMERAVCNAFEEVDELR